MVLTSDNGREERWTVFIGFIDGGALMESLGIAAGTAGFSKILEGRGGVTECPRSRSQWKVAASGNCRSFDLNTLEMGDMLSLDGLLMVIF